MFTLYGSLSTRAFSGRWAIECALGRKHEFGAPPNGNGETLERSFLERLSPYKASADEHRQNAAGFKRRQV
jgi:hypothetical protein